MPCPLRGLPGREPASPAQCFRRQAGETWVPERRGSWRRAIAGGRGSFRPRSRHTAPTARRRSDHDAPRASLARRNERRLDPFEIGHLEFADCPERPRSSSSTPPPASETWVPERRGSWRRAIAGGRGSFRPRSRHTAPATWRRSDHAAPRASLARRNERRLGPFETLRCVAASEDFPPTWNEFCLKEPKEAI